MRRVDVDVSTRDSRSDTEVATEPVTGVAPRRSVRRATARRASKRRAVARRLHGDEDAAIIEFLGDHPRSTAGDLARALNLDPEDVATRLAHLANLDEIVRAPHGYTISDHSSSGASSPPAGVSPRL
jgi:hypothetical protein